MTAASSHQLRLVGNDDTASLHATDEHQRASEQVINENHRAGKDITLDPTDPRWVLAVRTQTMLEGSMLTPERRQRLMKTARLFSILPFDANVIIAIVQDHARQGLALSEAAGTIALVRRPPVKRSRHWMVWIAATITAAGVNGFLIWWLLEG